jgi:hypothetical protein
MDPREVQSILPILQRRVDDKISEILFDVHFASHYEFDQSANVWHKQGIEGALYLVKRRAEPIYKLVILNRLASKDYAQSISADMEFEKKDKNIWFFREATGIVQGIWSPSDEQLDKCFAKIQELQHQIMAETQALALKSLLDIGSETKPPPTKEPLPTEVPVQVASQVLKPEFFSSGVQLDSRDQGSCTRENVRQALLSLAQSDQFLDQVAQALRNRRS